MSTAGAPSGRRVCVAGVICCAVLVTACGGGDETATAGGSPSATVTSSLPEEPPDGADGLTAGLLPADAFGERVTVVALSREQLRQSAGLVADPDTLDVSPDACREVLASTQPPVDDYDDVAAQSATVGATTTVEVLLRGELTSGAVSRLTGAVERCPEAQIRSPELGEATLTFQTLDVPATGDAVAAVRYTTTLTQGGQDVSVPALVGLVQDGDRLVTLLTIATDGSSTDAAAFTSLLVQAFEVQAEELG